MSSGNVINNNFNIINNFVGCPESSGAHTQDYHQNKLLNSSRGNQQPKVNNWMGDSDGIIELNENVVNTIVNKLGYTDNEVRKYVLNDKNSFVGVLYQKLVDD
jgi:hypothetical protein